MADEAPKPSDESPKKEEASKKKGVSDMLKTWGIPALVFSGVTLMVVWIATYKQIDKANQKMADLMARVGAAEERARLLEAEAAKYDAIVNRISKHDPAKLTEVLDLLEKPEMKQMVAAADFDRRIRVLGQQVATIYAFSKWGSEDPQTLEPETARTALGAIYYPELEKQLTTGDVTTDWLSDDISMKFIKAYATWKTANDSMARRKLEISSNALDRATDNFTSIVWWTDQMLEQARPIRERTGLVLPERHRPSKAGER
jgi:hypothetical protein